MSSSGEVSTTWRASSAKRKEDDARSWLGRDLVATWSRLVRDLSATCPQVVKKKKRKKKGNSSGEVSPTEGEWRAKPKEDDARSRTVRDLIATWSRPVRDLFATWSRLDRDLFATRKKNQVWASDFFSSRFYRYFSGSWMSEYSKQIRHIRLHRVLQGGVGTWPGENQDSQVNLIFKIQVENSSRRRNSNWRLKFWHKHCAFIWWRKMWKARMRIEIVENENQDSRNSPFLTDSRHFSGEVLRFLRLSNRGGIWGAIIRAITKKSEEKSLILKREIRFLSNSTQMDVSWNLKKLKFAFPYISEKARHFLR